MSYRFYNRLILAAVLSSAVFLLSARADEPSAAAIPIATIKHPAAVDFEREIIPILRANCFACHNRTTSKAELILETPGDILKGGDSGPAVVAGNSAQSLLLRQAAHQEKPFMPPRDNKVAAKALTSEELGLIKRWIDQGAKGEVRGNKAIAWKAVPKGLSPVYAVAVSGDGQY